MLLLRGHLAVCDMSHLQNWFSIVMTPVWPMAPLSRYFWPGSGSDRSNNSPANHLQYQSSPSLYLGNILDTMSPITPARPGHVASSGSEDILTPRTRTEKYRQRKWASESRGTCRQDTSHIRPLPSADKFSPLGAGTSLEGRESRRLSLPQWILGSKTWLNNLWPYETFSPSDTETINP